jgi:phosphate:Na+ symporter
MISALIGGIGLFLLGMTLMTEGLKTAAGGALRDVLGRFTGGPFQAFASGAALTALVQSSSATIVMTIGFVSAGLLTFAQAIGVIFGAAVGTTSTGWLVAFLGLKYSVSVLALPLVGVGALLHLLGRRRVASIGLVVAGFGLIFVGIDTLQLGMTALADRFELGAISAEPLTGRLLLVAIGILMTVVMQSSSAAVATTLAALHVGSIELDQAASLVIGQNVGTTVTAGLAALGASMPARRTALAHILLNTFSGAAALALLPIYLALMGAAARVGGFDAAEQIALFHTTFTLVGVMVLLPLTRPYADIISRLVVDREPRLTRYLDASVRSVPSVAVEAARRTIVETAAAVMVVARPALLAGSLRHADHERLETAARAMVETRGFLDGVRSSPDDSPEYDRHLAALHSIDHVERLIDGLRDLPAEGWFRSDPTLDSVASEAQNGLSLLVGWLDAGRSGAEEPDLEELSRSIAERRRAHRPFVMAETAAGRIPPDVALRTLDAMRWIDRLVYHAWRLSHHLGSGGAAADGAGGEKFDDPPETVTASPDSAREGKSP